MSRRLLKRRGWRAPTGPELLREIDRCQWESRDAFDRDLGTLSPDELRSLAVDIELRAASAADQLRIVASSRAGGGE